MAHGAIVRRAAGREQCVDQGAQRTDGVNPRPFGLTNNEHLQGAQLTQRNTELKIAEYPANPVFEVPLQILILDPRDIDDADLGKVDVTVAVYYDAQVDIDLPPGGQRCV